MTIWVDGSLLPADAAPARDPGALSPFETMGAHGGELPLWADHLARLGAACRTLGLPFSPVTSLRAAAGELLRSNGHGDGILRLSLVPGDGRVRCVMASRPRGEAPTKVRLLPTVVPWPAGHRADLKVAPRAFYDEVQGQAQDGGADDGLVIAADGAVLETAIANVWLRIRGVWVTPALDGRVLPGIARARLLAAARQEGLPVGERACDLGDVHRAEALATSSAVYGPRPAVLAGQPAPAVRFVDEELVPLWRLPVPD